ncbi:BrnT family toxin [Sphingobium amiense]|uniref:BrnT family toxin n=1 Tax=Sphingobium amiense TaxID=135719 RepID=UPI00082D92A3|nr:BrnT family toxin [Sphingobium amiense]
MKISFDPAKREKTLAERGLDFADAARIFAGRILTALDDRIDYGEDRYITYGYLDDRAVILVWAPRHRSRRIISMRYANDRERQFYEAALD